MSLIGRYYKSERYKQCGYNTESYSTQNVAWHIRLDLTEAMKEGEDGQKFLEVADDAMAPL